MLDLRLAYGSAGHHPTMTGPVPEEEPRPRDVVANEATSDETEMLDAQDQEQESERAVDLEDD